VLELLSTDASIVSCFAAPDALDSLVVPSEGVVCCRVAPDEIMLIGQSGVAEDLVGAAHGRIAEGDAHAVVLDASDGWAVWTLAGSGADEAFGRLSAVDPTGRTYTAGDVARVPVRIVSFPRRLHLLVGAMWRDYLHERLLEACRGLGGTEGASPVPWTTLGEVDAG
jgi:hypothetical protein